MLSPRRLATAVLAVAVAVAAAAPTLAQYVEVTPPASAVTASTHDGNVPANTVDNTLSTRWSANGDGQWIQYDLGTERTLGYVRVAAFSGNTRRNVFDLQVSTGGGIWATVWSGQSSGTSTAEETYDFADVPARWVRYLGHGNSSNEWNSVSEVSVFAAAPSPTPTPTPTAPAPATPTPTPTSTSTSTPTPGSPTYVEVTPAGAGATASTHDGNVPANAVDNNLVTRWSANGDGAWLQLDLGSAQTVGHVRVAAYSGNSRRNRFDLQVATTSGVWTTVWSGESSGTTTAEETYDFADVSARWVRYLGHGNSTNAWNSVSEVSVFALSGGPASPTPTPTPTTARPTPTPTPTPTPDSGQTFVVSSISELQSRINSAAAGHRIVLRNGTYSTSGAITVSGKNGTASSRIVVAAESVGGATVSGSAGFAFSGSSYVTIEGFRFTHAATQYIPADSHHIRLTRNVFQLASTVTHWVDVSGDDAEVDHNVWQNKSTLGVYLAVHGPTSSTMCKRIWIHHNYFRDHSFSGSNGGEPIRLGVSGRALDTTSAIVEYNLFERTDGDPETISLKSSGNTVRYNTIRDSEGCIVFRHGNASTVYGNFVLQSACGIRVYGNDHKIYNNMLVGITGTAVTVGSGTVQDHYVGEPSTSRTGNDASERVRLMFNTIVNAASRAIGGEDRTYPPRDWVIANNILQSQTGTHVTFTGDSPVGFFWEGSILWGAAANGDLPSSGYRRIDPSISADAWGVYHLAGGSPAIDSSYGSYTEVTADVDGHARSGIKDVGADEFSTWPAVRRPLTASDVGPGAP